MVIARNNRQSAPFTAVEAANRGPTSGRIAEQPSPFKWVIACRGPLHPFTLCQNQNILQYNKQFRFN